MQREDNTEEGDEKPTKEENPEESGLLGLLKMFDLRTGQIVLDALIRIFESNSHIMDDITLQLGLNDDNSSSSFGPRLRFCLKSHVG